ncbi:MAG: type IV pilus secretin PilQ [Deltaproteobacteria bacterium]|nr:type IV pilus secretin PilQ [Deltaproteobacteria bacterium]
MTGTHSEKKIVCLIFVVLLTFLVCGCAANKDALKKDAFFEKWKVMAEKSKGHSPAARSRIIEPSEGIKKKADSGEELIKVKKLLPTKKTSLKMHKTDIAVVLKALARAAGQNILINSSVNGDITPNIVKVPWDQAFLGILRTKGLIYTWEGEILRVMTLKDMEHDLKIREVKNKQKAQHIENRIINIDYADANKLCENLKKFLTKDSSGKESGSVTVDEHTNSLIVQAASNDIATIIKLVQKLDKPSLQIRIEANIVETSKGTARDLGIQWGGMYGNKWGSENYWITPGGSAGKRSTRTDAAGNEYDFWEYESSASGIAEQGHAVNFPADIALKGASLGLMFGKLGGNILDLQLSALQEEGELNILSSPSITTLDHQTAYTENGEKVPYVSLSEGEQEVKFEDAVLKLEITPHVIDGESLKMDILIKKDEVDMSRAVDGNPFIIKKETKTTLFVKNGETIVISGLTKNVKTQSKSGVPWLKDVPGLGWLFKGESKDHSMEEVLIFMTPHILKQHVAKR